MSWRECFCGCHSVIPVDIRDRVHAATACSQCHDAHVQRYVKGHPLPPKPPVPDTSTAWSPDEPEPE